MMLHTPLRKDAATEFRWQTGLSRVRPRPGGNATGRAQRSNDATGSGGHELASPDVGVPHPGLGPTCS